MATLEAFFNPKSVAIIGASRFKGKIGYEIFWNFAKGKFRGKVWPVNPNAKRVLGLKAYASVKDVPGDIDLAVIVVPALIVPAVLKECVEKSIPAVIIISGGFSEIGPEGKAREERCKRIIKGTKTKVIGPNCVGIYDAYSNIDTLFLSKARLGRPMRGGIAFVSQSGAVGSTILDWLAEEGVGISKFISYGNAIDVNESDLLEYLSKDIQTKVITTYLEGVWNGRAFLRAAKIASSAKPTIVLKAGKTAKGTAAVSSHTGALAGAAEIYSGALKQTGVLEAKDFESLFDLAKAFAAQPLPRGSRIAIITNGGGYGVLATDEAERQGLKLPPPSKKLSKQLRAVFPSYAIIHNPIDLTGDATTERYKAAIEGCMRAKEYDSIVAITLFQVPTLETKVVDVIARLSKKYSKPIVCCATGGAFTRKLSKSLERQGVPLYPTPERAVKVIASMLAYAKLK